MFPTLQLGPLSLQVPGLALLVGMWLGLNVSERRAKRRGENPGDLYNLVLIAVLAGLFGARLSYAIAYPGAFSANPISLVSLNPGLLDPFAGGLIAAGAAYIYLIRRKLPFWNTLDSLTPLLAVMGIAVGVAHLASGSAFGKPTDLAFGIQLWGAHRHPSQVYEIFLACLILAAIWALDKTTWVKVPGNLFLTFLAMTSLSRLFLEAFRGDSLLLESGVRAVQLASWGLLGISLLLIILRNREGQELAETQS